MTTYCIDTSCLIAAWDERYPPENFPKFWEYLDKLIGAGRVRAPEAVLDETSKRSKELHDWLKERPDLFIGYETDIQLEVKTILTKYPKLVAVKKTAFAAEVPSRRWWKLVGVVSGLLNPNDSSVGPLDRRPRHDEGYHEGGGCRRRHFAFR